MKAEVRHERDTKYFKNQEPGLATHAGI